MKILFSLGILTLYYVHPIHAMMHPGEPKVSILYRSDGAGKGVFWDHYTLQILTQGPTRVVCDPKTQHTSKTELQTFFKQTTQRFPHTGDDLEFSDKAVGVLVIPGSLNENNTLTEFEQNVLKQALHRGQPILGLCAGALKLATGLAKFIDPKNYSTIASIVPVKDHKNSSMMSLNPETGHVRNNTKIHFVSYNTESRLLNHALSFPVNSVHNQAVCIKDGTFLCVTAYSAQGIKKPDGTERRNRSGAIMHPAFHTVEAYETRYGVPITGLQWHPEAYINAPQSPHALLLNHMADAGKAFRAKQKVLAELKNKHVYTREKLASVLPTFLQRYSAQNLAQTVSCSVTKIRSLQYSSYGQYKDYTTEWERLKTLNLHIFLLS